MRETIWEKTAHEQQDSAHSVRLLVGGGLCKVSVSRVIAGGRTVTESCCLGREAAGRLHAALGNHLSGKGTGTT
jgi:hypothetical protein